MATIITIDQVEYDLDTLNDQARAQLDSVRVCDQKLGQLEAEIAIIKTARNAYGSALKGVLPEGGGVVESAKSVESDIEISEEGSTDA